MGDGGVGHELLHVQRVLQAELLRGREAKPRNFPMKENRTITLVITVPRTKIWAYCVGVEGIGPSATSLSVKCSTNELHTQILVAGSVTPQYSYAVLRGAARSPGVLLFPSRSVEREQNPFKANQFALNPLS